MTSLSDELQQVDRQWRSLRQYWDVTRGAWRDSNSTHFEQQVWQEMEKVLEQYQSALEKLSMELDRAD